MTVADFEAAGLYDPAAPGAADRLALLQWLAAQGASLERHGGELALAEANLPAIQALEAIPHGVRTILRAHMETAIRRLRAARREELMPDTVQVTVGFVDLVGYTRLSGQLDARALGTLVERFEAFASDTVAARDGRVVKLIGDEVMFVAVDAAAACDIALTLLERFADDPSVTPRGGLARGPALMRSGDYYGPVVNLASRVADLAVPREILVTAE